MTRALDSEASSGDGVGITGGGRSPLDEVEYWRGRHSSLLGLSEAASSTPVQRALDCLRSAGSPLYRRVEERFEDLSRIAAEAYDAARFLSTLERHLRTLRDGTPSAAFAAVPALVDGLRMVWTVSKHYNRDERMVPLMERIAWQLVQRVRERVDVATIFKGVDLTAALNSVSESRQMLEAWRMTYIEVRARIEQAGPGQRRWEFDRSRLFADTDHAASVCADLHEAIAAVDQFRRLPELAAVTGGGGGGDSERGGGTVAVTAMVNSLPDSLESVGFDLFDRSNEDNWLAAVERFHSLASEIELAAGSSIEAAFRRLRSAEGAFDLVENFRGLRSRPSIHRRVDERYADILEQYDQELAAIQKTFKRGKEDGPQICIGLPPSAGAITWALDLYWRAKRPILRFRVRDGLLSVGFGKTIKDRYLSFARSIDEFKDGIFKDWEGRVHSVIAEGLRCPVLVRLEDGCGDSGGRSCVRSPSHRPMDYHGVSDRSAHSGQTGARFGGSLSRKSAPLRSIAARSGATSFATGATGGEGTKGLMHNAFGRVLPLGSNFPADVVEVIAEAKQFEKMGFAVPNAALTVALQEEKYNR